MYFIHQNIMQSGDPMELSFEGLKMTKWNVPTDRVQVVDKKWVHSSGYHVYSRRSFSCTFMLFSKFDKFFCCQQQKIQKSSIFDILITITLEINMITQQMDFFFFHLLFELFCVGLFQLCISKDFQNSSSSVPHLLYVLVFKIHIYWLAMTLRSILT